MLYAMPVADSHEGLSPEMCSFASGPIDSFPVNYVYPSGMDFDSENGWIWQVAGGYNSSTTPGWIYTVDPSDGSTTLRFFMRDYVTTAYYAHGCHYDETNNYLYVTTDAPLYEDGSEIICFDVTNPESPVLVDMWVMNIKPNMSITYKDPYFYMGTDGIYGEEIRAYTLHSGGTFTLEDSWTGITFLIGGLYYDEALNVFYSYAGYCPSDMFYILDGNNPSNVLQWWEYTNPTFNLGGGCLTKDADGYLWRPDEFHTRNLKFADEYAPQALEQATWSSIKASF